MIELFLKEPLIFAILITIFLFSLAFHELAHGFVAKLLGDDTAELQGRLTLNPIAHIDPLGAIMFLLAGFGWAKPVPINPYKFTKTDAKTGMGLVAIAGPLSNVLLALLLWAPFRLSTSLGMNISPNINNTILSIAYFGATVNIALAAFNLIPIPPLDGSKILQAFTMQRMFEFWAELEQKGPIILLLIFLLGDVTGGIFDPIGWFIDIVGFPFRVLVFGF